MNEWLSEACRAACPWEEVSSAIRQLGEPPNRGRQMLQHLRSDNSEGGAQTMWARDERTSAHGEEQGCREEGKEGARPAEEHLTPTREREKPTTWEHGQEKGFLSSEEKEGKSLLKTKPSPYQPTW